VKQELATYSPTEEFLNIWSHLIAAVLAVVATVFLVVKSLAFNVVYPVSVLIFGVSMVVLFGASALYHSATKPSLRARLRIFDHCAIFVFIAGTYTPFALLVLQGNVGWWIFGISWGLAALGVALKLFFTGRFKLLSTCVYVFMGWIIVFAGNTLLEQFSSEGFYWLLAGGVVYTIGAVLYSLKKLPFSHATFHVMVIIGCACHFHSVYSYVLV
jgi:hemolysin III